MELRHNAQIKAKAEKANEITILATPCLELVHGEQLNDYEPTNNYEQTNKDEPLKKKQRNNRRQNQKDLLKQKQKTVGLKLFQCHLRRQKNL
jgi:peroxiredoxin family protein